MQKKIIFIIVLSVVLIANAVNAQRVKLLVQLHEADTFQTPLVDKLVNIIGTSQATFTDAYGVITLFINKRDSIKLFVQKYQTITISLHDSIVKKEYFVKQKIQRPEATTSKAVIVRPIKTYDEIRKDLEALINLPKNVLKPDVSPTSPITALYESYSQHALNRDKLRAQMSENNRRIYLATLYRFYNKHQLMNLNENQFEQFTNYHGLPLLFFADNDFYDVTTTLIAYYKSFIFQH